ncbi:response regulator transcription factor [Streptomyces sp. SS162]|uniref:response regulator transcription factor n=1 Tax=Streptomyces sp. SS162 TaxID=3108484 RepID=UPI002F418D60
MIRVLVVDDHAVVRAGLVALLNTALGIGAVGEAADAQSALAEAVRLRPDVALLDIDLPGGTDGIALAAALTARVPDCRPLMLTALDRPGHLERALRAGARGYLLKSATAEETADAIRRVAEGGRALDPRMRASRPEPCPLTEREAEALRLAAVGATAREIAADLFLSVGTVRNRLSSAVGKLHARTLVDAIGIAQRHGWI